MADKEKNSVIVELYDLIITDKKDDRFGRVVTTKSLGEDDLIRLAVARRTDLNASTIRLSLDILKGIAAEELANGASVNFGLGYFHLDVHGVFIGDHAEWDPAKHSLRVKVTPVAEVRETVKAAHVQVRGMAQSGMFINSVFDVSSGEENTRLTSGGGVNINGVKIRIAGDHADNGIRLANVNGSSTYAIADRSILLNDPSKITFIVPTDIPAGNYKLSITTQYSTSSQLLIAPRTYVFDYPLTI
jgi:hypothetical protein